MMHHLFAMLIASHVVVGIPQDNQRSFFNLFGPYGAEKPSEDVNKAAILKPNQLRGGDLAFVGSGPASRGESSSNDVAKILELLPKDPIKRESVLGMLFSAIWDNVSSMLDESGFTHYGYYGPIGADKPADSPKKGQEAIPPEAVKEISKQLLKDPSKRSWSYTWSYLGDIWNDLWSDVTSAFDGEWFTHTGYYGPIGADKPGDSPKRGQKTIPPEAVKEILERLPKGLTKRQQHSFLWTLVHNVMDKFNGNGFTHNSYYGPSGADNPAVKSKGGRDPISHKAAKKRSGRLPTFLYLS